MPQIRKYKPYVYALLVAALVVAFSELLTGFGWLKPLENIYYDLWHQLAGVRNRPGNVVIVTIDDQALLEYKDEPLAFWGPYFAKAIQVLRNVGVRVIGIDFLFSVSAESWLKRIDIPESELSRTYDIPIRTQLSSGKVVLIANLIKNDLGRNEILMPVVDYLYALPNGPADVGFSNLYLDDDDVVRRFIPILLEDIKSPRQTFPALLARRAIELSPGYRISKGTEGDKISFSPETIGFVGPPKTFPRISIKRLLDQGAESENEIHILKDKVVIIAPEHSGSPDSHLTPYARGLITPKKAMMSGAEIHANIVETILTGRYPKDMCPWIRVLWITIFTVPAAVLFFKVKPSNGLACALAIIMTCSGISYLFFLGNRYLPVGSAHLSIALSYIGSICFKFTGEEKSRKRLQQVIGPYVSDAVVEKILFSDKLPELGGEYQDVTVLFSDIRNFTTISEFLEPQEVVEMLNRYYGQVCEPILAQGAFVDKFIGDAIMAIFGAPVSYPDQARRCISVALAMVDIADDFRRWFHRRFPNPRLPEFQIGIGIHSGRALVGNVGTVKRMGYTAIGDTTNTAARLESKSKELGWTIVASRKSVNEAGNGIVTGRESVVSVKGKQERIEVIEIIGLKEVNGGC